MSKSSPNIERLKQVLDYEPETGLFMWKCLTSPTATAGSKAGSVNQYGYIKIGIDGSSVLAHRAAWAMHHGEWPDQMLDHANGDRADNRIANLRLASASQNGCNSMHARGKSKLRGAFLSKDGTYFSRICRDGKQVELGTFKTAQEAHDAYKRASLELHGEFSLFQAQRTPAQKDSK